MLPPKFFDLAPYRRGCAVTFFVLLGVMPAGASEAAKGPVVELPKFVVTDRRDLPPPEAWRYARLPGIEILSNASDRATERLVNDFQLFRQALDVVWPMPSQYNTPVLLILCAKGGKFASFLPANSESGPEMNRASVYLNGRVRSAIVIDLESTVINILSPDQDDPTSGVDSTRFSIEHNKQLYREYIHYLLSRSSPRLPAWFEEGMAQIVMAMQFDTNWIEFGKLHDPNTVSAAAGMVAQINAMTPPSAGATDSTDPTTSPSPDVMAGAPAEDQDFNAALAHRALLPMGKFFAVGYKSPEALNPLGNNVWAKQAYAFVHMGLFGERGRWQKPFTEFLVRSAREPVTEALMKACFHMSYREMGIQLRGYIQSAYYESKIYRAKDGRPFLHAESLALRDASPAEVGRIKGEAMELAGNTDGARTEFIAPYIRGESDPDLLAALGLSEHAAGKDDRARKFLAAATAGNATDPDAYLELARLDYDEAQSHAAGNQFSAVQATTILQLLDHARRLPPPNPAAYELRADTLVRSPIHPQRADVTPLVEGVQLYPADMRLVFVTAALCAEAGIPEAAHSLVEHGIKHAPDPATRAQFEQLLAKLPPDPTAPAPGKAIPTAKPSAG